MIYDNKKINQNEKKLLLNNPIYIKSYN